MSNKSNKPNNEQDIFSMAQKIAQDMPINEGDNVDMGDVFKHVMTSVNKMMGSGEVDMNVMASSLMQSLPKEMGNLAQNTSNTTNNTKPSTNSKIILPGNESDKKNTNTNNELKNPTHKDVKNYEELDEDEETDDFAPRTKDIEISLNVTLEDFYNGSEKKLAIRRKRLIKNKNGKLEQQSGKAKIKIPISKGMKDGAVLRFNKEADEALGYETGDIVVTLYENAHSLFEREGDNLFIMKDISLYEAFSASCGEKIELTVPHLDGSILKFKTDGKPLHMNDGIRKITGQGMPKYKKENEYGDLYVRFNLILPKKFIESEIEILKKLFPPCNKSIDIKNKKVKEVILEEVSEEDLEKLDYNDYTDDSDDSDDSDSYYSSEDYGSSESEKSKKTK